MDKKNLFVLIARFNGLTTEIVDVDKMEEVTPKQLELFLADLTPTDEPMVYMNMHGTLYYIYYSEIELLWGVKKLGENDGRFIERHNISDEEILRQSLAHDVYMGYLNRINNHIKTLKENDATTFWVEGMEHLSLASLEMMRNAAINLKASLTLKKVDKEGNKSFAYNNINWNTDFIPTTEIFRNKELYSKLLTQEDWNAYFGNPENFIKKEVNKNDNSNA